MWRFSPFSISGFWLCGYFLVPPPLSRQRNWASNSSTVNTQGERDKFFKILRKEERKEESEGRKGTGEWGGKKEEKEEGKEEGRRDREQKKMQRRALTFRRWTSIMNFGQQRWELIPHNYNFKGMCAVWFLISITQLQFKRYLCCVILNKYHTQHLILQF